MSQRSSYYNFPLGLSQSTTPQASTPHSSHPSSVAGSGPGSQSSSYDPQVSPMPIAHPNQGQQQHPGSGYMPNHPPGQGMPSHPPPIAPGYLARRGPVVGMYSPVSPLQGAVGHAAPAPAPPPLHSPSTSLISRHAGQYQSIAYSGPSGLSRTAPQPSRRAASQTGTLPVVGLPAPEADPHEYCQHGCGFRDSTTRIREHENACTFRRDGGGGPGGPGNYPVKFFGAPGKASLAGARVTYGIPRPPPPPPA